MPEKVHHKEYGDGKVVKIELDKIYVSFDRGQRVFPYPEAFENGYLSADVEIESTENDSVSASAKQMPNDSIQRLLRKNT